MKLLNQVKKHLTTKKCRHCGIPLNGWRYNLIVKPLCRITPKSSDVCCKCAEDEENKNNNNNKK